MSREVIESRGLLARTFVGFRPYVVFAATLMVGLSVAGSADAAPHPHSTKAGCFTGGGGICDQKGKTKSFFLDTSATGSYAGVNVTSPNIGGAPLSSVNFSFDYLCSTGGTTTCATGGSPEYGFPIDINFDGATDAYAFIDASNCNETGTVDNNCPVYYMGSEFFPNWAAFALKYSTATIASSEPPFILAEDTPFVGTIFNITLTRTS